MILNSISENNMQKNTSLWIIEKRKTEKHCLFNEDDR